MYCGNNCAFKGIFLPEKAEKNKAGPLQIPTIYKLKKNAARLRKCSHIFALREIVFYDEKVEIRIIND